MPGPAPCDREPGACGLKPSRTCLNLHHSPSSHRPGPHMPIARRLAAILAADVAGYSQPMEVRLTVVRIFVKSGFARPYRGSIGAERGAARQKCPNAPLPLLLLPTVYSAGLRGSFRAWGCRRHQPPGRSAVGVRRDKAALSSGCKAHPANSLPPEAIGAVMEVTKWLKPSIGVSRFGDSASVQAAT